MADTEPRGATTRTRKKKTVAKSPAGERVRHIVGLMSRGEWYGYATRAKLAVQWGIQEATVRQDAAEAHRQVKADPEQLEQDRLALANWLRSQRRRAARRCNLVTGLPDVQAAIKAAELELKCRGIDLETAAAPTSRVQPVIQILALPEGEPSPAQEPK